MVGFVTSRGSNCFSDDDTMAPLTLRCLFFFFVFLSFSLVQVQLLARLTTARAVEGEGALDVIFR